MMSFETTMVCDGCSSVIAGGGALQMVGQLARDGGRVFAEVRGGWQDVTSMAPNTPSIRERHLCVSCVKRRVPEFYDGEAVPA